MKKRSKSLIALVLVLALTLSLFAGCGKKPTTSDDYLLETYGMTFKDGSAVYNGKAQGIEVSASAGSTGYTVTYAYTKNGSAVDASKVVDAGKYEVVATVSDSSDETYTLGATFEISKAPLSIKVPNQYVRTGSDATKVETVLSKIELLGDDEISDLGLAWDVKDIKDIKAMTEVKEGKALGVTSSNGNYDVKVEKGTLYVLSYADYTAVGTLDLDVANLVEYEERFDELTYSENNAYASAAKRVLDIFENEDNYTEIQLVMLGDIDKATITANKAIADKRTSQGYSLDWDTEGDISTSDISVDDTALFNAVKAYNGDSWDDYTSATTIKVTDEDKVITDEARFEIGNGFVIDYDGRKDEDEYDDFNGEVKYGDYFYFVIQDYNLKTDGEFEIDTLYVRNKEVDYSSGKQYKVKDKNGADVNVRVYKLRVDSTTLGAIGTNSDVEIIVQGVSKYHLEGIDLAEEDNYSISSMYIESKSDIVLNYSSSKHTETYDEDATELVDDLEDTGNTYNYFISGETYELSIYMKDGFTVSKITIGDDFEIDGSEIVDNKISFTVDEDTFGVSAGDDVEIVVETVKSFDFSVKVDSRTIRSSTTKYETDNGSIVIDNLRKDGSNASIVEGDELDFQFIPADNFYVTSVQLYAKDVAFDDDNDTTGDGYYEFIGEVSSNGKLTIDFSEDCDYFDFELIENVSALELHVTFAEKYAFEVVSDDVSFKQNAAGEWVSDYGVISILDTEQEVLEYIAKGDLFTVYAELEGGYIISSIKVNTTNNANIPMTKTVDGDAKFLSDYAEDVLKDREMYFFQDSIWNSSDPDFTDINTYDGVNDVKYDDIYYNSSNYKLDAGETITIEVEFDKYYEFDYDNNIGNSVKTTVTGSFYKTADERDYIVFANDEDDDIKVTFQLTADWVKSYYKDHTGYSYGDSAPTDPDYDDEIDEVVYWLECENKEMDSDDISASKFSTYEKASSMISSLSSTTYTLTVELADMMDLVDVGDIIILYIECEPDYN